MQVQQYWKIISVWKRKKDRTKRKKTILCNREVRKMEKEKLEELAKSIIDYLKENCHPYTSVVITEERVTVVETILSIPSACSD